MAYDQASQAMAVLPAYAGMIPTTSSARPKASSAPRVCGDDPAPWTIVTGARGTGKVLPAYAGMIRRQ